MKFRHIVCVLGGGVLILGFQNCAKTSFGSANGGDVTALNSVSGDGTGTGTGDVTGNLTQDGNICTQNSESNTEGTSAKSSSSSSMGHSCTNMGQNDCDGDKDTDLVACILVDSGKSLKLGLVGGALAGVDSVASSVCISKSECLGNVAKAFSVQGAYERGYCDGNPNVTRLTDAQVNTLLGIK